MENVIYTYRYLIKLKDSEHTAVCVHSLTLRQHDNYMTQLLADDDVVSVAREYLHEIDVNKMYLVDKIKIEGVKEDEKIQ